MWIVQLVRVKEGESEWFRKDSVTLAVQCIYGWGDRGGKEEGEIPGGWDSVYCLASCVQITWFYVVIRRRT